jgi:hypothetical protein
MIKLKTIRKQPTLKQFKCDIALKVKLYQRGFNGLKLISFKRNQEVKDGLHR